MSYFSTMYWRRRIGRGGGRFMIRHGKGFKHWRPHRTKYQGKTKWSPLLAYEWRRAAYWKGSPG